MSKRIHRKAGAANRIKKGLGPIIRSNLDCIKNEYLTDDLDFVLVVSGKEGMGKSTLAWLICKYVDSSFNANRIAYDSQEFKKLLNESKPGQAILLDEGEWLLYSRESMTRQNIDITKILAAIRLKNILMVICIPSFLKIDSYVRSHRAKALAIVPCRGRLQGYNENQLEHTYRDKRTGHLKIPGKPFRDSFKKVKGPEWEEYLKRKREFVSEILTKQPRRQVREYAILTNKTPQAVYKSLKEGRTKGEQINGTWWVDEEEFKKFNKFKGLTTRTGDTK